MFATVVLNKGVINKGVAKYLVFFPNADCLCCLTCYLVMAAKGASKVALLRMCGNQIFYFLVKEVCHEQKRLKSNVHYRLKYAFF